MPDAVLQSIRAEIKACTKALDLVAIWTRVADQLSESQRIDICHAICSRYQDSAVTHDADGYALVALLNELARWP